MAKKFDKLLDKATDGVLLEADWEMIMNCVDMVRGGELSSKAAVASVSKRMQSDNPHIAHHALIVLEALVKNCGQKVHKEVATKEFMEFMKHLTNSCPEKVKAKILELLQCWAHAFRDSPEYRIVKDTHNLMKLEGHVFPVLRESDAMFMAEAAPDWVDADHCFRCRAQFTLINRKHHCRNCGQIFCDKCSGRYIALPHIGIEREVRVCETCFDRVKSPMADTTKKAVVGSQKESSIATANSSAPAEAKPSTTEKSEAELREEEEMALALALSQSEAEEKERLKYKNAVNHCSSFGQTERNNNSAKENYMAVFNSVLDAQRESSAPSQSGDVMSELARYLDRQYWEEMSSEQKRAAEGQGRRRSPSPSAPVANDLDSGARIVGDQEPLVNGQPVCSGAESSCHSTVLDDFVATLNDRLNAFVNRLKSNRARGRSVVGDTALQAAFMTLTTMHSDLLKHLKDLDDRRGYFENLQDKLQQVRDAREAVDALRQEHAQKRQTELYEMQQLRHAQMLAKLQTMRIKKHEMLEHQRLAAIRKMEDEQRQLDLRQKFVQSSSYNPATAVNPPVPPPPPPPTAAVVTQQLVYPPPPVVQQQQQPIYSQDVPQPQYAGPQPTMMYSPYPTTVPYADHSAQSMMGPHFRINPPHQPPPTMMQQPVPPVYATQSAYMIPGSYGSVGHHQEFATNYGYAGYTAPMVPPTASPAAYPYPVQQTVAYAAPSQHMAAQYRNPYEAPPVVQQTAQSAAAPAEQQSEGQLISFD